MSEKQANLADESYRALADRYGTPLYVYDSDMIRQRIDRLRRLHPAVKLFYSMKANPNPSIVRTIYDQGVKLEICSPRELDIALSAGASPARMMYLGPGKSRAEIERILSLSICYFIVESAQELAIVQEIAQERDVVAEVGLRFNPLEAKHGARLKMGGAARQFGIDEDQLPKVLGFAKLLSHVRIRGIHGYLGTRILQADTIVANIKYILDVARRLLENGEADLRFIGLGGGFGIPYYEGEAPLNLESLICGTESLIDGFARQYPAVELLAESGRYIVAESGVYLTRVRYTKQSQGIDFAITDGGIHHHAAAGGAGSLIKRNYPIQAFVKGRDKHRSYRLSGPLCTPDDLIGTNVALPELRPGDLIGVMHSGAYGLTYSPVLFLSHALPREVLTQGDRSVLIRDFDEYARPALRRLT